MLKSDLNERCSVTSYSPGDRLTLETVNSLFNFETGEIKPQVFFDDAIYQLELERLFSRAWLFVGHEAQIQRPGDFISTYMGEDPLIVIRQRDGSVKAFLNQCRHKGMKLCRADKGRAKAFKCTYHGWVYDIAGKLVNVPFETEAYFNELDKEKWGAVNVAKIESYRGFLFATWDKHAPDLQSYLGEMRWYLDAIWNRTADGMQPFGGVYRWILNCNWKMVVEQPTSDMYHVATTHRAAQIQLAADGLPAELQQMDLPGAQFSDSRVGHGAGFFEQKPGVAELLYQGLERQPHLKTWMKDEAAEAEKRLGKKRAHEMFPMHMSVFPSAGGIDLPAFFRVAHPRGPHQTELWMIGLTPANAPEEIVRTQKKIFEHQFSPAGLFEADDGENFVMIQDSINGHIARHSSLACVMGLGHPGRKSEAYPGNTTRVYSEEASRNFYRSWQRFLRGDSWEDMGFSPDIPS